MNCKRNHYNPLEDHYQRVVNDWNKLPEECINATSVNMFKNKIDQYFLKTRRE